MARVKLTNERIRTFFCPEGKARVFLWDTVSPRLAVRATAGSSAFVFQGSLSNRTVRITIGDVRNWKLDEAREEACVHEGQSTPMGERQAQKYRED